MPIKFAPTAGQILSCDFSTGFQAPEMVKVRPVLVVSPRRRRLQTVTVVPLSTVAPERVEAWHYQLSKESFSPYGKVTWAKCDMVTTVATKRLDRVRVKGKSGERSYLVFEVTDQELEAIHGGIKAALGLV